MRRLQSLERRAPGSPDRTPAVRDGVLTAARASRRGGVQLERVRPSGTHRRPQDRVLLQPASLALAARGLPPGAALAGPAAVRAVAPLARRRDRKAARRQTATSPTPGSSPNGSDQLRARRVSRRAAVQPRSARSSRAHPGVEPGFVLCVSRLLPYKHVDVGLAAIRECATSGCSSSARVPTRIVAVLAPSNALIAAGLTDAQLRWAYRSCAVLLAISHEDYGLTPLEAAAFGRPTVALRYGGYLDTIAEGICGLFVERPEPALVRAAIERVLATEWSASAIQEHARAFAPERFHEAIREAVIRSGRSAELSLCHHDDDGAESGPHPADAVDGSPWDRGPRCRCRSAGRRCSPPRTRRKPSAHRPHPPCTHGHGGRGEARRSSRGGESPRSASQQPQAVHQRCGVRGGEVQPCSGLEDASRLL